MKSIAIRNNYNLAQHQHKLHFDELPLVVAYIRYGHTPAVADLPGPQMAPIVRMLTAKFGMYGFNVIWVIEEASGSLPIYSEGLAAGEYRPGLTLVAELLSSGYGKYLAVSRIHRLTRSLRAYLELEENVLAPNGVQLLVASGPDMGPGPGALLASIATLIAGGGQNG